MVLRSDVDNKGALKNYVYKNLDFFSPVESFHMLNKTYQVNFEILQQDLDFPLKSLEHR